MFISLVLIVALMCLFDYFLLSPSFVYARWSYLVICLEPREVEKEERRVKEEMIRIY